MDIILIRVKKNDSISEEFPSGEPIEKFVTKSQMDKLIELWGEDYFNISESELDNIVNQYP